MVAKKDERLAVVYIRQPFHDATAKYLKMEDGVRARLPALIHYDKDVADDGYAELITGSHAYNDLTGMTEQLLQAVLIKVLEFGAQVVGRGLKLHVGDLVVTRQVVVVSGDKLIQETAFVPVKMV